MALNKPQVVKYLLQNGAKIREHYQDGCTPLIRAINSHQLELRTVLIESMKVNVNAPWGNTSPLKLALIWQNKTLVDILLKAKAHVDSETCRFAREQSTEEIADNLEKHYKANTPHLKWSHNTQQGNNDKEDKRQPDNNDNKPDNSM